MGAKTIRTTKRDEFLITMYHCDHMKFAAFCDDDDCNRIEFLTENLTEKQISQLIENYNLRVFGVTYKECQEKSCCLLCKDVDICDKR